MPKMVKIFSKAGMSGVPTLCSKSAASGAGAGWPHDMSTLRQHIFSRMLTK